VLGSEDELNRQPTATTPAAEWQHRRQHQQQQHQQQPPQQRQQQQTATTDGFGGRGDGANTAKRNSSLIEERNEAATDKQSLATQRLDTTRSGTQRTLDPTWTTRGFPSGMILLVKSWLLTPALYPSEGGFRERLKTHKET
jgi:hypothetical protein